MPIVPRMRGYFFLPAVVGLLLPTPALSLDPTKKPHQHLSRSWDMSDGLPQTTATAIVQTKDGYVWIGTQEGLVRFDGLNFTVFDKHNTAAIKDSFVRTLHVDERGGLWAGTNRGLLHYERGRFSLFLDGLPSPQVEDIVQDAGGSLWVATRNGLARMVDGRLVAVPQIHEPVNALAPRLDGGLWVGTVGSLILVNGDDLRSALGGVADVGRGVLDLWVDIDGTLWVATRGAGIYCRRGERWTHLTREDGLPDNVATVLLRDRAGSLWIGTERSGLVRYREGRFRAITRDLGLTDNWIESLHEDREGGLWVGTASGGVLRFWDGRITPLTRRDGLLDNFVWSIHQEPGGAIWIGTNGGANRFDPVSETMQAFTTRDGLPSKAINTFFFGQRGVWIGTEEGASLYRAGRFETYTVADGLSGGDVRAVLEDARGVVWLGIDGGGVDRLQGKEIETLNESSGLISNDVNGLFQDHLGAIWIATDRGLSRWEQGELESFTGANGFADTATYTLYEDEERILWIGTDSGLFYFRDGRFESFTVKDGLPFERIYAVLEDDHGRLWMSGNKGIFCVTKAELDDVASGRRGTVVATTYGTADGLLSSECNFAGGGAGFRAQDGTLWFATIAGVAIVDPEAEVKHPPPEILLTRISAGKERLDSRQGWISPPGVRSIEIHYTAPSFLSPTKIAFAYRLRGLNDAWIEAGTRRVAHYANLDPGRYVFEVFAKAADGTRSEGVAAFTFVLTPTFFQTPSFYLLAALASVLLVSFLYRWRLGHLRQRGIELVEVVRERTEQLREANEQLTQLSFCDVLTGLHNRRFLLETVDLELADIDRENWDARMKGRASASLVFLMMDLDHFKAVNDNHGHAAGDRILSQCGQVLQELARSSDILVRWGGEEFMMVATRVEIDTAAILAERIRKAFADERFDLGGGETTTVTCSIGYAAYPFVGEDPRRFSWENIVALADQALYAAKHSGRAMWVGISATQKTGELGLTEIARRGIEALVRQGRLGVDTSASDPQDLTWQAPIAK